MHELSNTDHFKGNKTFDITSDDNTTCGIIDVNALELTVSNIVVLLSEPDSCANICTAIEETNMVNLLIDIPKCIQDWNLDFNSLLLKTVLSLATIVHNSSRIANQISYYDKITRFFDGLMMLGLPSLALIKACVDLAYDKEMGIIVLPDVITKLIDWLPNMNTLEQDSLSELIFEACTRNHSTYVFNTYHSIELLLAFILNIEKLWLVNIM